MFRESGSAEQFFSYIGGFLTLSAMYLATLLMRYVGVAFALGEHGVDRHVMPLRLLMFAAAALPMVPIWRNMHELIDKTNFTLAVIGDHFGAADMDAICRQSARDSDEREGFKGRFISHFNEHVQNDYKVREGHG